VRLCTRALVALRPSRHPSLPSCLARRCSHSVVSLAVLSALCLSPSVSRRPRVRGCTVLWCQDWLGCIGGSVWKVGTRAGTNSDVHMKRHCFLLYHQGVDVLYWKREPNRRRPQVWPLHPNPARVNCIVTRGRRCYAQRSRVCAVCVLPASLWLCLSVPISSILLFKWEHGAGILQRRPALSYQRLIGPSSGGRSTCV
jgi:hypothetical protein